jgi:hypothetical protein
MHVFKTVHDDDQQIEARGSERNNKVSIVVLLILLTLHPVVVQTRVHIIRGKNGK